MNWKSASARYRLTVLRLNELQLVTVATFLTLAFLIFFQFRAKPMPDGSYSSYWSTSLNRRNTISTTLTKSSEEIELDKCRKQFRAKPSLPDPASET